MFGWKDVERYALEVDSHTSRISRNASQMPSGKLGNFLGVRGRGGDILST